MKKLLVIILLISACCKKEQEPAPEPEPTPVVVAPEVYCFYRWVQVTGPYQVNSNTTGPNGKKVFLECVDSKDKRIDAVIKYRNQGIETTSEVKSNCTECQ